MKTHWVIISLGIVLALWMGTTLWADSATALKTCVDTKYGFQFQYPPSFDLREPTEIFDVMLFQNHLASGGEGIVAAVYPPDLDYPQTTMVDAFTTVSVSTGAATQSTCQKDSEGQVMDSSATINGIPYYVGEYVGIEAGSRFDRRIYHTFQNNRCYEITVSVLTVDVEDNDAPQVQKGAVFKELDTVVNSFQFKKS